MYKMKFNRHAGIPMGRCVTPTGKAMSLKTRHIISEAPLAYLVYLAYLFSLFANILRYRTYGREYLFFYQYRV